MKISKNIQLAVVLILIIGGILYLGTKPGSNGTLQANPEKALSQLGVNSTGNRSNILTIQEKAAKYPLAPELTGLTGFLNGANSSIQIIDLRGKVVLLDFWTYSCINCIRTIPLLNSWHDKYSRKGLVIIGVHTPEFDFEKDTENVRKAVQQFGIKYYVVQDNNYATWTAYKNSYWPREYFIDKDGFVRYNHIGEGFDELKEKELQQLLSEIGTDMNGTVLIQSNYSLNKINSPEIYFGYDFQRQRIGNDPGQSPNTTLNYTLPEQMNDNVVYLQGEWKSNSDNFELAGEEGIIDLNYNARDVNIVAGSDNATSVQSYLNGETAGSVRGTDDDSNSTARIMDSKLYNVIRGKSYGKQRLELRIRGKGFRIFTFTFS